MALVLLLRQTGGRARASGKQRSWVARRSAHTRQAAGRHEFGRGMTAVVRPRTAESAGPAPCRCWAWWLLLVEAAGLDLDRGRAGECAATAPTAAAARVALAWPLSRDMICERSPGGFDRSCWRPALLLFRHCRRRGLYRASAGRAIAAARSRPAAAAVPRLAWLGTDAAAAKKLWASAVER
ncbi:hypothetical protein ON010_g10480 [Phytophthora cinnamomi]|nr:hypothetical protein ON010_g10480 [Phytophthora cinnamomi]